MNIDLSPDNLVSTLTEPGVDPNFVTIVGWVGEGSDAESVRIYTTQALDEYVEFPTSAIVHREKGAAGPQGPSLVWVRAEVEGTKVQTAGRAAQLAILNGEMTDAFLDDDEVAGFALETSTPDSKYGPVVKGSSPTITVPIISGSIIYSAITVAGVDDRKFG
jgi:hypothetical protein